MYKKKLNMTEFDKLDQMLTDAGIQHEREDSCELDEYDHDYLFEYHQLRHPWDLDEDAEGMMYLWSAICSTGSYGHEQGLLELYGRDMVEPEGWISAEKCFEMIKMIEGKKHE